MHGLIFETSICYWQDQPGRPPVPPRVLSPARAVPGGLPTRDALGVGAPPAALLRVRRWQRGRGPGASPGACTATVGHLALRCTRVERMLSAVAARPRCAAVRYCRQERGATDQRVRENELPEAPWGLPRRRRRRSVRGTEAGRAGTALGRSVGVPLGETGRLGLARPGGRRGGAEERLRRVLRALGSSPTRVFRGRWRRAASTVRAPRCGRRGPRQGRPAFAIRSGVVAGAGGGGPLGSAELHSEEGGEEDPCPTEAHDGLLGIRPEAACPARAGWFSYIRAGKSLRDPREIFSKQGKGTEPGVAPGSGCTSRGAGRRRSEPRLGGSLPGYPMAGGHPRFVVL